MVLIIINTISSSSPRPDFQGHLLPIQLFMSWKDSPQRDKDSPLIHPARLPPTRMSHAQAQIPHNIAPNQSGA